MAPPFVFQISQLASNMFAAECSMFAFCGGAAVGQVTNPFGSMGTAIFLRVISVWPMELAYSDSITSMPSMCVCGLDRWLDDKVFCVECCIWLGWSLGAFAASAAVLLCEKASIKQCAFISFDSRTPFPI